MNQNEIEEYLLKAIDIMILERFKELAKFNYYIEATVASNNPDGTCNIELNGQILNNIKKRQSLTVNVGEVILVCIVNGNFSNKFIDLKRP